MIRSWSLPSMPRATSTRTKEKPAENGKPQNINVNDLYRKFLVYYGIDTKSRKKLPTIATTTPPGPYSSADLVGTYNDNSRLQSSDELRISNGSKFTSRSQSLDLDRQHTRSKDFKRNSGANSRGCLDTDRDLDSHHDRNREDTMLPCANQRSNYFKPIGMRNNYLTGQPAVTSQNSSQRGPPPPINSRDSLTGSSPAPREPEDLVAMGTNWNPPPGTQTRSNGRNSSITSSGSQQQAVAPSNSIAFGSSCPRRLGPKASMGGTTGKLSKDNEPKYADPAVGTSHGMQQRIAEIAGLESETIRWEKTRKVKKKAS